MFFSPTECILPCPRGWKCCKKIWGRCVCKRPIFRGCCKRIPNPICVKRNAICWGLKRSADLALRGGVAFLNRAKRSLDVAKGPVHVGRALIHAAKRSLDVVIRALEGVKRLYSVGVKAVSALTRFTLTKIINIREVHFKVGLSVANGGKFRCQVRAVLMGRNVVLHLHIDTRNIWSIARQLANRALGGLSKFIG